jgi:hypothetical protein
MLNRVQWPGTWAAAGACWLVVWIAFFLWAWHTPPANWPKALPALDPSKEFVGSFAEGQIRRDLALWLGLLMSLNAAGIALLQFRNHLWHPELRQRACSFAAASAVFFVLSYCEVNAPERYWYEISTMMTKPASVPVYGQRLLFVWPAMLLKHLAPRLAYSQAFVAFQLVALALAIYLIGQWSEIFIRRQLKFLGQFMLGAMLAPTFGYLNGHDFGVVASYTLCFLLLYKRQYWLYGIAFCIGILNHQNILLLIPTAFAIMWGRDKRRATLWTAALTTVAYLSIRYVLNQTVPIPQTHEIKVWHNIRWMAELAGPMLTAQLAMVSWVAFAAIAWTEADAFLKRASILLPMQYGVYFLFGQLDELRLFNGVVPIIIGFCLCHIRWVARQSTLQSSKEL